MVEVLFFLKSFPESSESGVREISLLDLANDTTNERSLLDRVTIASPLVTTPRSLH